MIRDGVTMSGEWIIVGGAIMVVFLSAVLRGFSGFGFALAASPLLALLFSPRQAVPVVLLLQIASSLMSLPESLKHWEARTSLLLAAGAILTTPLGVHLLGLSNPDGARLIIAFVTLGAAALLAAGRVSTDLSSAWRALPFGLAAGILGGATAMPGPPVIAYFMARDTSPATSRASMNLIFLAIGVAALLAHIAATGMARKTLFLAAICTPAMMLGTVIGSLAFARASPLLYRRVGLIALVLIAITICMRVSIGWFVDKA